MNLDAETSLAGFGREHPEILRLVLFGSVARGDAHAASDIDLAVTFAADWKAGVGGFEYFGHLDHLERELSGTLGKPVHLTDHDRSESSTRTGNGALGRAIARDGRLVYEADSQAKGRAPTHR